MICHVTALNRLTVCIIPLISVPLDNLQNIILDPEACQMKMDRSKRCQIYQKYPQKGCKNWRAQSECSFSVPCPKLYLTNMHFLGVELLYKSDGFLLHHSNVFVSYNLSSCFSPSCSHACVTSCTSTKQFSSCCYLCKYIINDQLLLCQLLFFFPLLKTKKKEQKLLFVWFDLILKTQYLILNP